MFYVGVFAHYEGATKAASTKVRVLEKLGHSSGRGERFLNTHTPKMIEGLLYRSIVFVLPDGFRLRNDLVQKACQLYQCQWAEAKFQCYRMASTNAIGKEDAWRDLLQATDNQLVLDKAKSDVVADTAPLDVVLSV